MKSDSTAWLYALRLVSQGVRPQVPTRLFLSLYAIFFLCAFGLCVLVGYKLYHGEAIGVAIFIEGIQGEDWPVILVVGGGVLLVIPLVTALTITLLLHLVLRPILVWATSPLRKKPKPDSPKRRVYISSLDWQTEVEHRLADSCPC